MSDITTHPTTKEENQLSPILILQEFIKTYKSQKNTDEIPHACMLAAVRKISADYALDEAEIPMLLCTALITEPNLESKDGSLVNQVEQYAYLFHRYIKKPKSQKKLLAYIYSLYKQNKKSLHYFPVMLQQFYNEYLLDPAVLRDWIEKKKEKTSPFTVKLCAAATPFLKYLDEVESK